MLKIYKPYNFFSTLTVNFEKWLISLLFSGKIFINNQ